MPYIFIKASEKTRLFERRNEGERRERQKERGINFNSIINGVIDMAVVKTAYKYRAYPSKDAQSILNRQMALAKELYNLLLEKSKAYYREAGKTLTEYRMNVWLTQMKSQSAMEYLTTYGWAILIVGIVLSVLYASGFFSPNVTPECIFPDFSCLSFSLSGTGSLNINIAPNNIVYPINITAVGCNIAGSLTNMTTLSPEVTLSPEENYSTTVSCYDNGTIFSGSTGSVYEGYFVVRYIDTQNGFPFTELGKIVAKVG